MNEEEIKEAKYIALSLAKLREFCQSEECAVCPFHQSDEEGCYLIDKFPNEWDVDALLYRIGFYAGRRGI